MSQNKLLGLAYFLASISISFVYLKWPKTNNQPDRSLDIMESTFDNIIAAKADELVEIFYATMFARYPAVAALFAKVDMKKQKKHLINALVFVRSNLRKDPTLVIKTLEDMGKRHINYGTLPEHYPVVKECMLFAMSKVAGSQWTPEINNIWDQKLSLVNTVMIEGSKK